jgi:hypothetical protein
MKPKLQSLVRTLKSRIKRRRAEVDIVAGSQREESGEESCE